MIAFGRGSRKRFLIMSHFLFCIVLVSLFILEELLLCTTSFQPFYECPASHYGEHAQSTSDEDKIKSYLGGWFIPHNLSNLNGPCTIKKVNWTITQEEFLRKFAYTEPVILVGVSDQSEFRRHSTRHQLLSDYGYDLITVTTANTYSYPKVQMTLYEYIDRIMKPQEPGVLGKDTLYHFGDNDRTAWDGLFSHYQYPPYYIPELEPVLSFGLAGPGTGVPFHIHGPTFAETIFGRKRWFLYPPDVIPTFDPDVSTLDWVNNTHPYLSDELKPLECVLHPGEVLYFPNLWWHATLNLDAAVFMSTFLA